MKYASAGHPRRILKSASGRLMQLDNGGAVLGVFPNWKYEDSIAQLAPGDQLVLFTDGITEAAKADGVQFGEEGLIQAVKRLTNEPPSNLNAELLTDVKSFCDSHLKDDATLITIAVDEAYTRKNSDNHISSVLTFASNS